MLQATNVAATASTPATGVTHREEIPLDLTVKSDSSPSDSAASQITPAKRHSSGDPDSSQASKRSRTSSNPASPISSLPATIPMLSQRVNGHVKPLKPERQIYR